ncbi:hypothetical protein MKX01_018260 [Papaver californicum]|nr:hypothetical protein MKX01_018260 [Papaver californicum]
MSLQLVLALLLSSLNSILSMALTNTTVLDIDGATLQTASNYYVVPVRGGGLGIGLRDNTCPFFVLQENFEVSNGIPLRFFHADRNLKAVNISVDVNVVFSTATTCVQLTAWQLGEIDDLTGKRYVKTGGIVGNPVLKVVCGDLGVLYEDGSRWLGLNDVPKRHKIVVLCSERNKIGVFFLNNRI